MRQEPNAIENKKLANTLTLVQSSTFLHQPES